MREKVIIFAEGEPMTYAEAAEKYGVHKKTLRSRAAKLGKQLHNGRLCPVFTEDDLRPSGEPRKTPLQREEPAPAGLMTILNRAFGCKHG